MRFLLVALLLASASPAAPREPCVSLKTMAAGTEAAAKLRCQAKATNASAGAPRCLARAEAKLRAAFGRAERGGGCLGVGDEPGVATLIDAFVSVIVNAVPPGTSRAGRRCAAAKLRSAGKTAARRLDCHAQALRAGVPVGAACLGETALRFTRAVQNAEDKGGCAATGDEPLLDTLIDAFTAAIVATLTAPGSVTTTTTTIVATTSSSDTTVPGTPSTTTTSSTSLGRTVSFQMEIQPIFATRCALPLCHSGPLPREGLNFTRARGSYRDLVGVASTECPSSERVLPGSPASSYLIAKLEGSGPCFAGFPMPLGGPPLPAAELNAIIQWIAEGAPDN
jgi:hypothetical protein